MNEPLKSVEKTFAFYRKFVKTAKVLYRGGFVVYSRFQNPHTLLGSWWPLAHDWFLAFGYVLQHVNVCVCVSTPKATYQYLLAWRGVIWTVYDLLNNFYSFYVHTYMAAVISIFSRCGLSTDACHKNQPNKSKLSLYKQLLSTNNLKQLYIHM